MANQELGPYAKRLAAASQALVLGTPAPEIATSMAALVKQTIEPQGQYSSKKLSK